MPLGTASGSSEQSGATGSSSSPRIAAAFEESVYGTSALYIGAVDDSESGAVGIHGHGYVWADEAAKQRELAGNVTRIEGWRNTRSYYSYIQVSIGRGGLRPMSGWGG